MMNEIQAFNRTLVFWINGSDGMPARLVQFTTRIESSGWFGGILVLS